MANIKISELVPGLIATPDVYVPGSVGTETFRYSLDQILALAQSSLTTSGDLNGPIGMPLVIGLQGNPVSDATPDTGDILKWSGTNWQPEAASMSNIYESNGTIPASTTRIVTVPNTSNLHFRLADSSAYIEMNSASSILSIGGSTVELIGSGSTISASASTAKMQSGSNNGFDVHSTNGLKVYYNTSLSFTATSATTDATIDNYRVIGKSSGTPANGFGISLVFAGKSSTTENRDMIRTSAEWLVAADGTRTATWTVWGVNNAGSLTQYAKFGPTAANGSNDLRLYGALTVGYTSNLNTKYIKIQSPSDGNDGIEIGTGATINNTVNSKSIAIGKNASANRNDATHAPIAIGYNATANGNYGIAIGQDATALATNSIVLGRGATATTSAQMVFGQNTLECQIQDYWFNGVNSTTDLAVQPITFNMSRATGINIAGANWTFNAGVATGNATGGDFIFQTTQVATSGAIRQSHIERVRIKWNTGHVGIGATNPSARLDVSNSTGYNQLRLRTSYTPTATNDANGNTGDVSWDDSYFYLKTSAGWKRSALSTF